MDSFRRFLSLAYCGLKNYLTKRPLCISFEVTHSCNAKCIHCHLHGPERPHLEIQGYMPNCRTGERFFNVNPNGTISPCGLIITNFKTREEFLEGFCKNNSCVYCYTSIRANTEKSPFQTAWDNLHTI